MSGRAKGHLLMRFVRLFILVLAGSSLGWPAPSPALEPVRTLQVRSEVWIDSDRVKLLSLFEGDRLPEEWKTLMAGIDLGEAPALGSEKFIGAAALRVYLEQIISSRGLSSSQVKIELPPDHVTIRRKAHRVSSREIEEIYRNHILSNSPWRPEDLEIKEITHSGEVELPAGIISHIVEPAPRERYVGKVSLTIHFYADAKKIYSARVSGKVQRFQETVVAARPLGRSEIITERDVQIQRVQVGENSQRYVSSLDQVPGKRLLRDAALHQPLLLTDLDTPVLLKKGAQVTILFEQPGLRISAKGQAREEGGTGKTIRVLNVQTNRTVLSEVVDASTVRAIH